MHGTPPSVRLPSTAPEIYVRWLAWLLVVVVTIVTFSPIEYRPVTGLHVSLERFGACAAIGAAVRLGYPRRPGMLALVLALIGLLEAGQAYVPGRHGRISDGLVKASGVLLGAVAAARVVSRKRAT